jgi:hypothetical protein
MARWLRYAHAHLRRLFPYLPQQPGYKKRLHGAAALIRHCIRVLAAGTTLWTEDVWVVDSTPVECGRSRGTARRSDLAGWWAEYGYCASHPRYFWGLRPHLVCTLHGLPVAFALTGAKADEREVLLAMFHRRGRPGGGPAAPAAPGPPRRARARPAPGSSAAAPGHRVGQRHLQGPARSRTPRRPQPRRGDRPRPAAPPGLDRRHLAQRHHWPAGHAIPDLLRPLTPRYGSSR